MQRHWVQSPALREGVPENSSARLLCRITNIFLCETQGRTLHMCLASHTHRHAQAHIMHTQARPSTRMALHRVLCTLPFAEKGWVIPVGLHGSLAGAHGKPGLVCDLRVSESNENGRPLENLLPDMRSAG